MDHGTPEEGRADRESPEKRATAWISHGFEELLYELASPEKDRSKNDRSKEVDFDVVIVGSGYGGAIAAAELAGCTEKETGREISVCVLERGKEYLPGMFPSRMADLAGHVRFSTPRSARPRGTREGLFDVRIGPDVCALVANGLGGGSLINAGVMEEPSGDVFDDRWPPEFKDGAQRDALYTEVKRRLGAADEQGDNTIHRHGPKPPAKFDALHRLSGCMPFRPAAITIAMKNKRNKNGVALSKCILCGDCSTGCNHRAKESLDVNLLVEAWCRKAEIYTGAIVLRIERDKWVDSDKPPIWILTVVHTDEKLRKRQGDPLRLRARNVILAAGTFGSTEILLRSQSDALKFSPLLGQRFSTNGDTIAVAYGQNLEVNAVANESTSPRNRGVGPTITGIVDLRSAGKRGYLIEELAIPGPLRRAFEEIVTTSNTLHNLDNADTDDHVEGEPLNDPCAVDAEAICKSSVLAVMGHDDAAGSLELIGDGSEEQGDGAIRVRWHELRDYRLFRDQIDVLEDLARVSATDGRILPNALWQLLPDRMQFLLENDRGPLFTVHPLGGCPMGRHADEGVVDNLGRVFDGTAPDPQAKETLPGLVVLDGSIVPTSLGTNPALTIAALALRAVRQLRSDPWGYIPPTGSALSQEERPIFRETPEPTLPQPTEVEFVERMSGKATLMGKHGEAIDCVIELTLPFERVSLANLVLSVHKETKPMKCDGERVPLKRTLEVKTGELRVFLEKDWEGCRERDEPPDQVAQKAQLHAPVTGTLTLLHREKRTHCQRVRRALWAWFWNRGLRDTWQWLEQRLREAGVAGFLSGSKGSDPSDDPTANRLCRDVKQRWNDVLALASRAGEVRLLEYGLTIGRPQLRTGGTTLDTSAYEKGCIRGLKRLTYGRRSNPWRQLSQMIVITFPGLRPAARWMWLRQVFRLSRPKWPPVLELDTKFLAQVGAPLLRIVGQQDQPSALADLASFLAYFLRLLLNIHIWSFRSPDPPIPREPQRLPEIVEDLPAPQIKELEVDRLPIGTPVYVRLTRYRTCRASGRPVVMIHGYSASGTTYAHHAVRPNLAQHFCDRKRDVWILDLRTSSGMPAARCPWTFEDAALVDLPAAFDYIRRETRQTLDVFAHCMGAAMFSMAVLKPPEPGEKFFRERQELPRWIRRAVLSQIGPVVVMSPANTFRAYAFSYLRQFLPLAGYDFRVKPDPGLMDQLIDRFLATLPYPEEEFDIENPPYRFWRRTPFVGTRHRMDALYGRDFSLANKDGIATLDDKVLEYIDDLFGPLSIDTVSQGIHFTRLQEIANQAGRNDYVLPKNIKERWTFPTLSIHGEDNGLADVATLARMKDKVAPYANAEIMTCSIPGFGHQDCLIGKNAGRVFEKISQYLSEVLS